MRTPEEEMIGAQAPDENGLFELTRGMKRYELTNHLGNVLSVITDTKQAVYDLLTVLSYYQSTVISCTDYYPFGAPMDHGNSANDRSWSGGYRYGFNGKEMDGGIKSSDYDFGARKFSTLLGRWYSVDRLACEYNDLSPYSFAGNTPISAYDPDGRLIIFIGGLRLWKGAQDQGKAIIEGDDGIYKYDKTKYWKNYDEPNSFGEWVPMDDLFSAAIGDNNRCYASGSSYWNSQADLRSEEGKSKAKLFHTMVSTGEITLQEGESIKIVCHSQGGAHAAGFAEQLMSYKNADGTPTYIVEVIYYITPHQPTEITHPAGVRGVQYSHPGDAISSDDSPILPNGGSDCGPIDGITEYDERDIMGGENQPDCEGALPGSNRCGHNVTDNDFIFDIPKGQVGHVAKRKDSPIQQSPSVPTPNLNKQ